MIHKNNNNQGVFLELLVAANNTLHFDQYSRRAICFNIYRFFFFCHLFENEFEKILPLVCRACQDESIDIHITHCTLINIHASIFV